MTGHHIYTRSWYEYGSRTKNPGTFTVELTDGLFGPGTHDVVYNRLNPIFAQTQPTLAGYKPEEAMLRLFHPTPGSAMVSRSYFANDEITGRGMVQYSFGLVFTDREKDLFLQRPQRAFSLHSIELYAEFAKRVPDDRELPYSGRFDPVMADYADDFGESSEQWARLGFTEDIFVKYFATLGRCVAGPKGDQKLAALVPQGAAAERLILSTLRVLPMWLRRKFGAASRWAGSIDSGQKASLGGIQLLCYAGERPPPDALEAVVDLTGNLAHRNIGQISMQEEAFARWVWQNIGRPDRLAALDKYMMGTYRPLIDRMPFDASAHCFWLWHTFAETGDAFAPVAFGTACAAVGSLVAAFGRKFEDFFVDRGALKKIFASLGEGILAAEPDDIGRDTVRAVCTLAAAGFEIEGMRARSLTKPLFERLMRAEAFDALEPLVSYYGKYLKEEKPADIVMEAVLLFSSLTSCRAKRHADEAAAMLASYAGACAAAKLAGREPERRFAQFKIIIDLFKKQGRQFVPDYAAFEGVQRDERFAMDFYEIELAVRERFNKKPPGAKHVAFVAQCLAALGGASYHGDCMANLLGLYWDAEDLRDPEQRRRYVEHLFGADALSVFIAHGVGEGYARALFADRFRAEMSELAGAGANQRIEKLSDWLHTLTKTCGFRESDPIIGDFYQTMSQQTLQDLDSIVAGASPKALDELLKLLDWFSLSDPAGSPLLRALRTVCKIDGLCKAERDVSSTHNEWAGILHYVAARLDYWLGRSGAPPRDWALSRAVCEMNIGSHWAHNKNRAVELYMGYLKGPRTPRGELANMYEALRLVCENPIFDEDTRANLRGAIKDCIELQIGRLRHEGGFDAVLATADDFAKLYVRPRDPQHVKIVGDSIARHIRAVARETKAPVPQSVIQKFSPSARSGPRHARSYGGPPAGANLLFAGEAAVYCAMAASAIGLFLGGGLASSTAVPEPLLVAGGISAFGALALNVIRMLD